MASRAKCGPRALVWRPLVKWFQHECLGLLQEPKLIQKQKWGLESFNNYLFTDTKRSTLATFSVFHVNLNPFVKIKLKTFSYQVFLISFYMRLTAVKTMMLEAWFVPKQRYFIVVSPAYKLKTVLCCRLVVLFTQLQCYSLGSIQLLLQVG